MERFIKLPSVVGVAPGSSASIMLPVGPTYESVTLALVNITLAQITNIEVRINGKPIQKFNSGTELDDINSYHGRGASATGFLTIHFRRPELLSNEHQQLFSIGTKNVSTFTIHFDVAVACVSPSVIATCRQGGAVQDLGLICKVKRFPFNSAVSGEVEIDNLPRNGPRIAAVHLAKADVTAVKVDVDSINVYDTLKTLGAFMQTARKRVPVTARFTHIDFVLSGDPLQALRTDGVQDLRIKPTLGTSGALDIIVEYFDAFEGI